MVVDNDLYVLAGYAGSGSSGGYLSDAWCLRLEDEAAEQPPIDFSGSERCRLRGSQPAPDGGPISWTVAAINAQAG